jgi:site-specific recombinase XerD
MSSPTDAAATGEFGILARSWELSLRADGYADNTVRSYTRSLERFAAWLHDRHGGVGPSEVQREHVRQWLVDVRETTSSGAARSWFAGLRHFFKWAVAEDEIERDPTEGIRTPPPNDTTTPILTPDEVRAILGTCTGKALVNRRDAAIIYLFVEGGLRLSELANLTVEDVDVRERLVFVEGKGSNRSGPRRRAVPLGVKAAQALDRYLRERRKHPYAETAPLWLGDRGRPLLSAEGIDKMLQRRAAKVGLRVHPHQFRHTWADAFRAAGGSEGDLMVLGGWRSRAMLDRYGRTNAEGRAKDAYRRLSLGDRL